MFNDLMGQKYDINLCKALHLGVKVGVFRCFPNPFGNQLKIISKQLGHYISSMKEVKKFKNILGRVGITS